MLFSLCSLDRELRMEVCWNAEIHHMDIRSFKDPAVIVIAVRDIKFLCKGRSTLHSLGCDRNDIHLKSPELREVVQMKVGCKLRTDHSESHSLHFIFRSFLTFG